MNIHSTPVICISCCKVFYFVIEEGIAGGHPCGHPLGQHYQALCHVCYMQSSRKSLIERLRDLWRR
jgi:hypothetical protein